MNEVIDYLRRNHRRFRDELCEFVSIPSVSAQSTHRADIQKAADWLAQHCQKIGLKVCVHSTKGNPIVMASSERTGKAHYLIYGHYDVQPAEPFELWQTPPFEPTIRGDCLFGRGTSDNKGQHFAHLKAVEAFLATGTELPCDVTFLIEGEEEIGSQSVSAFLKSHKKLDVQGVVVSDNGMPSLKHPALTYGLRGVAAFELHLRGPNRDLHSGIYGGAVDNPAMVLCEMLSSIRSSDGRIVVDGFYDNVTPISDFERKQLSKYPESDADLKSHLGIESLFGERGFSQIEQRTARPTFEINGLTSGYQNEGSKTILPSQASAKVTCRLVPDQKPEHILESIRKHLFKHCPPSVKMEFRGGHSASAYLISPESLQAKAALRALKSAFDCDPILVREGGSIPIVSDFKNILKVDTLLLGLGLPDDNTHSPNEKISLRAFERGMEMSALLWSELGQME